MIQVGIIGTGNISRFHLKGYQALENVKVVACCDINGERAQKYAEDHGIEKVFTDYKEMLKLPELDAVSVCTWNNSHAEISIAGLKAGKHVLCEKPLAMNAQQAEEIQKAKEETGKLLMVGFVRRFGANANILKDFIDKDYLGQINYVKAVCRRRCGNPCGWFSDKSRSGGGPLIDLGVHVIDLARYLMGKPKAVTVSGAVFDNIGPELEVKAYNRYNPADPSKECSVEDFATAIIRFDNGAVMHVEASFNEHIKEDVLSVELQGTKAGAMLEPNLVIYSKMEDYLMDLTPKYTIPKDPFEDNFKAETAHFIDCIENGTMRRNPVEDGVELMKILDAVYRSAEQKREVEL